MTAPRPSSPRESTITRCCVDAESLAASVAWARGLTIEEVVAPANVGLVSFMLQSLVTMPAGLFASLSDFNQHCLAAFIAETHVDRTIFPNVATFNIDYLTAATVLSHSSM